MTISNNRHTYSSQPVVIGGFATILLLLLGLFSVWYHSVAENKRVLAETSHQQNEMLLIYQIRDGASRRAAFLLQMTQTINDPFLLDEQYIHFKEAIDPLLTARKQLLGSDASEIILKMWETARPHMNKGSRVQYQAAELMLEGKFLAAQTVIFNEVLPIQQLVFQILDDMLEAQRQTVDAQLVAAAHANRRIDTILAILAAVTLFIGVFVSNFVIRRSRQAETQLRHQSERIRSLYEISAISGLSSNDQISEMLRLGCQLMGMEFGSLLRADKTQGNYEIVYAINIDGKAVNTNEHDLLNIPLFLATLKHNGPLTVNGYSNTASSHQSDIISSHFKSYIGVTLTLHDALFGVLNFSAEEVRNTTFTDIDKDLITLMGRWVSVVLERIMEQSELADAKQIAESANHAKSAFIANISHEIRTPLTAIIGFANSLLDPSHNNKERNDAAQTIVRSGEHLHELINDILDLSKIEAGQLIIEKMPTSPLAIVAEVESVIGYRARNKGLRFIIKPEYPLPDTIINDPTRLKQILLNLCSNATKFTLEGTITILLQYDTRQRHIIFTVSDTGIGMDEEELTHIFQPFSQADSSTTRCFGGTGLGLWISRQLAQRLGGDITCKSEKGQGSSFEVRLVIGAVEHLKLIREAPDNLLPAISKTSNNNKHVPQLNGRVLLAEDNHDVQKLIGLIISKTGVNVVTVDNGQIAIEETMAREFDLILMDIQMPIMDGIEAATWLRNTGYSKPIIALSAAAFKQDQEKINRAEFDEFLTKPLIIAQFYDMLTKYLSPRKNQPGIAKTASRPHLKISEELKKDSDFLALVEIFIVDLPKQVTAIVTAANNADWDQVQAVSHKLKGSGAAFGFPEITDIAHRINQQTKTSHGDLPNQALLDNISALQKCCAAIIDKKTIL